MSQSPDPEDHNSARPVSYGSGPVVPEETSVPQDTSVPDQNSVPGENSVPDGSSAPPSSVPNQNSDPAQNPWLQTQRAPQDEQPVVGDDRERGPGATGGPNQPPAGPDQPTPAYPPAGPRPDESSSQPYPGQYGDGQQWSGQPPNQTQGVPAQQTSQPQQTSQRQQTYQPQQGYPSQPGFPAQPSFPPQQGDPGQRADPTQQGSPGQPGYGIAAGNPGQPVYSNQSGYPNQSVYPNQPGYPQQSGYPNQPGYPQQAGYPPQPGPPNQQAYAGRPGYPVPAGYGTAIPPKPSPMPTSPCEYQQLARGPRYAWWRPMIAIVLTVLFAIGAQIVLIIPLMIYVAIAHLDPMKVLSNMAAEKVDALTFAYLIAGLASLIPLSMLAHRIAHGVKPRYLSSVAGGFRWRWLLRCLVITVPIFVVYIVLQLVLDWQPSARPQQWIALLIMVFIGIPFQSAGEEYAFRGLVLQNVGAWFGNRKVALVVSIIPSVLLFAAAHGSSDPWIFSDLAVFAVSSCILVWRTGGLEASVALHASNNITIMIATILFGGWDQAFVSASSQGTPLAPLVTLVVNGVCVTLILWQAKRHRIQRLYQPAAPTHQLPPAVPQPY